MATFDPQLQEADLRTRGIAPRTASPTAAVITAVADVGGAVLSILASKNDRKILGGFQGTLGGLGSEVGAFNQKVQDLTAAQQNATDSAEVTRIAGEMSRLTRGMEQGGNRLSIQARARTAMRDFVAQNPHLAADIGELWDVSVFGAGNTITDAVSDVETQVRARDEQLSQLQNDLGITRGAANKIAIDNAEWLQTIATQERVTATGTFNMEQQFGSDVKVQSASSNMASDTSMRNISIAIGDSLIDPVNRPFVPDLLAVEFDLAMNKGIADINTKAYTPTQRARLLGIWDSKKSELTAVLESQDPAKWIKKSAEAREVMDLDNLDTLITTTFGAENSIWLNQLRPEDKALFLMDLKTNTAKFEGKSRALMEAHVETMKNQGNFKGAVMLEAYLNGENTAYMGNLAESNGEPVALEDLDERQYGFDSAVMVNTSTEVIDPETNKKLISHAFSAVSTSAIDTLIGAVSSNKMTASPSLMKHTNNLIVRHVDDTAARINQTLEGTPFTIAIDEQELSTGVYDRSKRKTKSLFRIVPEGFKGSLSVLPLVPFQSGMNTRQLNELRHDLDYLSSLLGFKSHLQWLGSGDSSPDATITEFNRLFVRAEAQTDAAAKAGEE